MSASYPSALVVNPSPPVLADLAYAAALAEAAERLGDVAGLDELWPRLVEEALNLIPADGAVIAAQQARSWSLLAVRTSDGATTTDQVELGVAAAHRQGLLTGPGPAVDANPAAFPKGWASVLVVPVDRRPSRVPTRLLWFADRPDGLHAHAELADVLARHAGAAARAVNSRENLGRAVDARHRIGQAQGILMARHRVTADQAFTLLVRRSQHTNTKLRTLAEDVILAGRLDGLD